MREFSEASLIDETEALKALHRGVVSLSKRRYNTTVNRGYCGGLGGLLRVVCRADGSTSFPCDFSIFPSLGKV